jgi:hypothetical protein
VGSSSSQTVSLTNQGNVSANLQSQTNLPAGFSASGCTSVTAGATCTMTVTFSPTAASSYSGSNIYPTNSHLRNNTLAVSGTGTDPAPTVVFQSVTNSKGWSALADYSPSTPISVSASGLGTVQLSAVRKLVVGGTSEQCNVVHVSTQTGLLSGRTVYAGAYYFQIPATLTGILQGTAPNQTVRYQISLSNAPCTLGAAPTGVPLPVSIQ